MIRKSKKGQVVGPASKAAMTDNMSYLGANVDRIWDIVKPAETKKLLSEILEEARKAGDHRLMLSVAKVMAEFLKIAASTGVQMADIQRKMSSGVPDNQVNVQVNAVSSVPSVEEAQRELERYCDLVGPNGADGRDLIGRARDVDGEVPPDHIRRETGGRGGVDIGRIAVLSPKDCPVPAERSPEDPLSSGACVLG